MSTNLAPKQIQFVIESTAKINLAHGSVRSGKTVATLYRFMQAVSKCPDSQIWMIGHTSSTIYDNAIRLLLEPKAPGVADPLAIFRPFCTWFSGKHELTFMDKVISTVGVNNSGAMGAIQGKTMSLCYCDEMTLYPEPIIDMIHTRLSLPHSKLFASMNPMQPTHKIKQWIDAGASGDENYYSLHFILDDNPYVRQDYKDMVKNSLSGVFYKRNYLGLWCLAEGAIFDFFETKYHVIQRPPRAADHWIVGVDYGTANAFAAVLIGVSLGNPSAGIGHRWWAEKELYWDSKSQGRQKVNAEYAGDFEKWLGMTPIKAVYVDPSAASFKLELQRKGYHCIDSKNEVNFGIEKMTKEMKMGDLSICAQCKTLIKQIEGYVWDPKKAEKGEDAPLKKDDHSVDALRYAIASHRISHFDQDAYNRNKEQHFRQLAMERGGGFR